MKTKTDAAQKKAHTSGREIIINAIGHGIDREWNKMFQDAARKMHKTKQRAKQEQEHKVNRKTTKQNKTQRY